jgi:hypothetical protein
LNWKGNGGTWRAATPEEIADGVYYESFEAYKQARGGDLAA